MWSAGCSVGRGVWNVFLGIGTKGNHKEDQTFDGAPLQTIIQSYHRSKRHIQGAVPYTLEKDLPSASPEEPSASGYHLSTFVIQAPFLR